MTEVKVMLFTRAGQELRASCVRASRKRKRRFREPIAKLAEEASLSCRSARGMLCRSVALERGRRCLHAHLHRLPDWMVRNPRCSSHPKLAHREVSFPCVRRERGLVGQLQEIFPNARRCSFHFPGLHAVIHPFGTGNKSAT